MDTQRLYEITTMKPSEFTEKYLNIQLLDYQKKLLDKMDANKYCFRINYPRGYSYEKRMIMLYNMCIHWSKMKDDDCVILVNSKGWHKMNKKELGDYLTIEFRRR